MTTTEQIVWAHRVDKGADVVPGATLRVYADLLPASDGTAPFAIHTFNQITGGNTIFPRQAAIANDHFVFTGKRDDDKQTAIGRDFARLHGIEKPYYATPGDGIFHFYFPEQGLVVPGQFIPGADSHSRAYGAYGAVGIGVGSTTLGFGWSTGYIYFTVASARRVTFGGRLQPWVSGKDIVLELLRRWGARQSQGMSVEFVDRNAQLPMAYRNTIANMMAEAEALNGIFAADDITLAWYRAKGITNLPYPPVQPGADARYELDETLDLSDVRPMIAKPFSPGNAFPATDVARERITFDKALIGSCTNGSYDDLLSAALVIRAARERGATRAAKEFVVFPGSGGVGRQIEQPDARLGGESIAAVFAIGRRPGAPVVVRPVLRPGPGCPGEGPARHHVLQPELAEPHGSRRRRVSGESCGRGRVGAARVHGAAGRARPLLESGGIWCLNIRPSICTNWRRKSASPRPAATSFCAAIRPSPSAASGTRRRGLDVPETPAEGTGPVQQGGILRTKANCLRICEGGPIAVVYPEGAWYKECDPPVLERIIQEHLIGGRVVTDYLITEHPLE